MRSSLAAVHGLGVLVLAVQAIPSVSASGLTAADLDKLEPAVARLVRETAAEADAHPGRAAAHGKLGMVYEANNLWPEARESYGRASALDPKNPAWRFRLAIAARETGDPAAALELLRQLETSESSTFPALRQRLGELLLESGDLAGARQQYRELMALAPEVPEGYVGVAETWLRERQFAQAAELLHTALALDPGYPVTHYLLGLAYRGLGRLEEAEREMKIGGGGAVRYLPDPLTNEIRSYAVNLSARLGEAGALLSAGRTEEAVTLLEEVVEDNPENLSALNNLAVAYMRSGELHRALQVLLRAREIDPGRFSTYLNLSSLAMRSGQSEEALEWADEAVERAPDQARTHATRAGVLASEGRFSEAVGSAARAAELDPGDLRAQLLLADLYLREKRFSEAKEALIRARALAPDHPLVIRFEERLKVGANP
jgi:tetratricopeptide (TPR) repeat protein